MILRPFVILLVLLALCVGDAVSANSSVAPLSIPPSEYFDGDDGQWSTFHIQVGTPGQTVRLLPGTSASAGDTIWVVIDQGCTEANPNLTNCAGDRGYVFSSNESTTWSTERLSNGGLFQLNTFEEGKLGLTGNAYYGFDTVTLGLPGSGLPTIQNELTAGIAANDFWLGSLGLSPIPFNFTDLDDPVPSLLYNLWNQSYIPSLSWSYTAGAYYSGSGVFGSLTLGGYDTSRFDATNVLNDVAFGADFSRDLLVQLESITYNTVGSSPLLTQSIPIFIDSMVSQLWLPTEVCDAFAQAFNLTWNSTAQLYLVDNDVHDALLAQGVSYTFTLGGGTGSNGTVDIVLPYAAFDLNVSQPIVSSNSRYFPLQQAQNDTQYTLGRVFLQEAYIIADYGRQNFSVAQALFPSTGTDQQLVAIKPPESDKETESSSPGLSSGAIAGIVIGAVVTIALLVAGVILLIRRKRQQKRSTVPKSDRPTEKSDVKLAETRPQHEEMENTEVARYEMDYANELKVPEMSDETKFVKHVSHEMMGEPFAHEMPGADRAYEMGSGETVAAELEAPLK